MDVSKVSKLLQNQALLDPIHFKRCVSLLTVLWDSDWNEGFFYPMLLPRNEKRAEFWDHLDDPWFITHYRVCIRGQFFTIEKAIHDQFYFQMIMSCGLEPRESTEPVEQRAKPEPARPVNVLIPCVVVSFRITVDDFMKAWLNDKTFAGILFKWAEPDLKASNQLLQDVWPNQPKKYLCPEKDFERYMKALAIAMGKYYAQNPFKIDDINDISFGVKINESARHKGFVLEDGSALFLADQVPWEELAGQGVLIKK